MFKKFLSVFVIALVALFAVACGETKERTYKADGEFTAFEIGLSKGAPQITSVTVKIKDDKVVSYFIDTLQSDAVKNEEGVITGFKFKDQTKKELKYAYRMHGQRNLDEADYIKWLKENNKLEWFEQAELVEKFFLDNTPQAAELNTEGANLNKPKNITGVTVTIDTYKKLAIEALENAKAGKVTDYVISRTDVVFATGKVDEKGKFVELELNTLQGNTVDGAFVWNEKNKQELKYAYGMHKRTSGTTTEEEYKAWLKENNKLEWFEQANIITERVLKEGIEDSKFVVAENGKLDAEKAGEAYTGVTITVKAYKDVLTKLYNKVK